MTETNYKQELLFGAEKIVNGDRNVQYGEPDADFKRIASFWQTYLDGINRPLLPHDVAVMMELLKISRLCWDYTKEDSWMDKAGYAACGWDCVCRYKKEPVVNHNPNVFVYQVYDAETRINPVTSIEYDVVTKTITIVHKDNTDNFLALFNPDRISHPEGCFYTKEGFYGIPRMYHAILRKYFPEC